MIHVTMYVHLYRRIGIKINLYRSGNKDTEYKSYRKSISFRNEIFEKVPNLFPAKAYANIFYNQCSFVLVSFNNAKLENPFLSISRVFARFVPIL